MIDVEAEADGLIQRAEEMLWPATERRVPWRDVAYNSITYPRWVWLPPRGLEQLRDIARGQGRWRWHEDGYIEKPPFPPAQTSVSVVERDYDADTGEATLLVTGREAGKRPRILYARDAVDLPDRPNGEIDDSIFKTPEVRLFFLAIDPDGTHETGEPFEWKTSSPLNTSLEPWWANALWNLQSSRKRLRSAGTPRASTRKMASSTVGRSNSMVASRILSTSTPSALAWRQPQFSDTGH